jgi:hypothetical protein
LQRLTRFVSKIYTRLYSARDAAAHPSCSQHRSATSIQRGRIEGIVLGTRLAQRRGTSGAGALKVSGPAVGSRDGEGEEPIEEPVEEP